MTALHTVVIPPLEHVHKSIKYTCSGTGLLKDGYPYDPHAEKLIVPKSKKNDSEAKDLEKKPVAYWKAQCAFRGLNQSGSINDLQLRMREAKKRILPELRSTETELNNEFKRLNKAALKTSWATHKTDEQKAKADPKRYLAEAFPKGGSGRPIHLDIVILKLGLDDRLKVSDGAESLDLTAISVAAPWVSGKKPTPDHWVVIGRDSKAVLDQVRQIERELSRTKQTSSKDSSKAPARSPGPVKSASAKTVPKSSVKVEPPAAKQAPTPAQKPTKPAKNSIVDPSSTLAPIKKQTAFPGPMAAIPKTVKKEASSTTIKKEGPSKEKAGKADHSWDICGRWRIRCERIEEQWGDEYDGPLTLDIFFDTHSTTQLYALFQFRVVEGIMRFIKPNPGSTKKEPKDKKRKHQDSDDGGDGEMSDLYSVPQYESEDSDSYAERDFQLGAKDKPTARRPTWQYRWRGIETGEGEIQLYSDQVVQSITFSDKGNKLSGFFETDILGSACEFTGVKVDSRPQQDSVEPSYKWEEFGEDTHEKARVGRWH